MKTTLMTTLRSTKLLNCLASALAVSMLTACAPGSQVSQTAHRGPPVYPSLPDTPRFIFERSIRGSADVVPAQDESILKQVLTGSGLTTETLGKPYAVAVYKGKLFLSDSTESFIKVFDAPEGKYYKVGDSDGPGQLMKPLGLDIDGAGNLFVADASARFVVVFDKDGKFVRKIGGPKFFDRLSSVTVDLEGERLYVVDIGGVTSELHRVRVFNARNGEHLYDIGKRGSEPGEFNLPRDVAVGKNGQLYVVDGGNFRVQVFDKNGKYVKHFGGLGRQLGNFARPKEVATDREGNVYVADAAYGNFQIFNADGELLMFVGDRSEQEGPGKYMLPSGIAVDDDGRIYFVDQWFRKVDIFRPYALQSNQGQFVYRPKSTKPAAK